MGERLLCKQEVDGSIPFTSTSLRPRGRRLPRRSPSWAKAGEAAAGYGSASQTRTSDREGLAIPALAGLIFDR